MTKAAGAKATGAGADSSTELGIEFSNFNAKLPTYQENPAKEVAEIVANW